MCARIGKDGEIAAKPAEIAHLVQTGQGAVFDHEAAPWALPPDMHLVVGDVRGTGSSTPSMVSAINAWRKEQPQEAGALWQHILGLNAEVSAAMAALAQEASENPASYAKALKAIVLRRQGVATGDGDAAAGADEIVRRVDCLMEAMRQLRTGMRTMGEVALMLSLTSHIFRSLLCDIHMHRSLLYFICV